MAKIPAIAKILSLLNQLDPGELDIVQLRCAQIKSFRTGRSRFVRPLPSKKPQLPFKPAKAKGPAQQTSKFANQPTYVVFKERDKQLRKVLKEKKLNFKEFSSAEPDNLVLKAYTAARDQWFRQKASLEAAPVTRTSKREDREAKDSRPEESESDYQPSESGSSP